MSACPACGVAVVPGYAKCPKCHAALPSRRVQAAGGTTASDRRFWVAPILVPLGILLLIVIAAKSCGGGNDDEVPEPGSAVTATGPAQPPQQPTQLVQQRRPITPIPTIPTGPSPQAASNELERTLRGRRLWSTIDVTGARIDVSSSACDDPGMGPAIDGVAAALHGAGLTHLRCLAQSGTIVFERDL